ncbi:TetR family transcriptional regulator [Micromonospora sp. NPDC049559]|uniref:TetR/AcrR family transcriptional regulator n=1 Tax=Micromonospora sp. NPDC049559 TaxID=3155923 RepID=UPI003423FE42
MTGRAVPGRAVRADRASATRELILVTAERLFAEHGLAAVSNRQVSEAAGQGNNAAVGYHFGTKTDLVRAIVRKHTAPIEELRTRMLAEVGDSTDVRGWVACLVRPVTEHLAALGSPTWFARFNAQMMTDPAFRATMVEEALSSPSLRRIVDGLGDCLAELPPPVRAERGDMARQLMVHSYAERERALAEGLPTPRASWDEAATGLIDAIVGLWTAPVTPHR